MSVAASLMVLHAVSNPSVLCPRVVSRKRLASAKASCVSGIPRTLMLWAFWSRDFSSEMVAEITEEDGSAWFGAFFQQDRAAARDRVWKAMDRVAARGWESGDGAAARRASLWESGDRAAARDGIWEAMDRAAARGWESGDRRASGLAMRVASGPVARRASGLATREGRVASGPAMRRGASGLVAMGGRGADVSAAREGRGASGSAVRGPGGSAAMGRERRALLRGAIPERERIRYGSGRTDRARRRMDQGQDRSGSGRAITGAHRNQSVAGAHRDERDHIGIRERERERESSPFH
ncbi:hypothetical protein O6H91_13G008300 [Diphasiastrum complanatum]|uniref:Uncharacterized protein n=1 Tax=Diphasiastrum complanatum TaxID=34168 RepID=A0ACC2BSP8_DIPCM|nr:hypothetical protein O6H91_13G008300 [Diphasiastrum complanatum]